MSIQVGAHAARRSLEKGQERRRRSAMEALPTSKLTASPDIGATTKVCLVMCMERVDIGGGGGGGYACPGDMLCLLILCQYSTNTNVCMFDLIYTQSRRSTLSAGGAASALGPEAAMPQLSSALSSISATADDTAG